MLNERFFVDAQLREMNDPMRALRAQMRREAQLLRASDRAAKRSRKLWLPVDLRERKPAGQHVAWI